MRKLKITVMIFFLIPLLSIPALQQELKSENMPQVTWQNRDDQGDWVKGSIDIALYGPGWTNKPDLYMLHIFLPKVTKAGHHNVTITLDTISPASINLAVDERKAYFKPDKQELYYKIENRRPPYSIREQGLGRGDRYSPLGQPHPGVVALLDLTLGKISETAGDVATLANILAGMENDPGKVFELTTSGWTPHDRNYYIENGKTHEIIQDAKADAVFANDRVNDFQAFSWDVLTDKAGYVQDIGYWFEMGREEPGPTDIYIRAVIPFRWGTIKRSTRYLEVEWKVPLPGVEQTQEEEDVSQPSGGWKGEYFNNTDLSGTPVLVKDEGGEFIDFDWGLNSPDSKVNNDFSARWTRTAYFSAGTYRFSVGADDGLRLIIDGVLRKEHWRHSGLRMYTVDVSLTAGNHKIVLEYFDDTSHAIAKLSWKKID